MIPWLNVSLYEGMIRDHNGISRRWIKQICKSGKYKDQCLIPRFKTQKFWLHLIRHKNEMSLKHYVNVSHFVVDTDSHFVVDTESHFVADNNSHFVVDTDSHFNVFKSECLRILNASLKRLFCVVWYLEYRIFIIAKLRLALHFKSSRSRKIAALTKCSLMSDWVKLAATASPV